MFVYFNICMFKICMFLFLIFKINFHLIIKTKQHKKKKKKHILNQLKF